MKSVTATEAKNNFGDLLMNAQSAPIAITRNGKEQGVLLSAKEYFKIKQQALQTAISAGISSGDAGKIDINSIKALARAKSGTQP
ncbi:type II toxin-antitoxin system Phd/YefM family antitoxin [Paraglaciecola sp. MB-3u-78]|uniref:type II toxin-antitoxin system Phd/YefM family antitoxin n=1 Tax=Paraglaciecola sp. MB-3u-78 TaxID=2058332 RepID=UPI000C31EBFF|nr:type II toxin-antitoxin system Phd/YefM family antitoxin [Paraglaciecola sp. MB-3u-78]PKG98479.1 prevent-host-death family protein [Paraglaciecola sp. MB-3u-78]